MKIIRLNLKEYSHNIYIGYNIIKKIPQYLKNLNIGNFSIIITNRKIYSLHKNHIKTIFENIPYKIIFVPEGEEAKSKEWVFKIIGNILENDKLKRKLFISCVGGGVVGDIGGFIASIYKRGIPYIQIPTTFLSQIDASIGGKTAINFNRAKNIIGTFYQPKAIFIDQLFLTTLPIKEIKQGIAEAIKYAVISNRDLFFYLKRNYKKILSLNISCIREVIYECVNIKAKIVEKDEKEIRGLRTILNFGHTIAHALEGSLEFKTISHGDAVSLGMITSSYLSYYLGICSKSEVDNILDIIKKFSLPTKLSFSYKKVLNSLIFDKKFIHGKIRMVLLKRIGEVEVKEGISAILIRKSLQHIVNL
ncbi:MAG: 3-dehydroquinate synthase [Candidatus Omnitrophica bacterium]|nr:3-dehydroquinate synthase [Candidatus Omnitrophota bacterium]MCM8826130.1 3-dehydroquinate synthase [Candidatus Omnitrophota bacterium]